MNKNEVLSKVAESLNFSKKDTEKVIDAFLNVFLML